MAERLAVVDFVRLLSILVVFAVHLASSGVARLPVMPIDVEHWSYLTRNGSYGVTMFFVISGFVITRTIRSRTNDLATLDLRGFYARRAGRILPPLALALLAGTALLLATSAESARVAFCLREPKASFDLAFFLAIPTFSFNWLRIARESQAYGFGLHWDILWSLAIEEQFYLGYPLLLRALRRDSRVVAALCAVVALGPLSRGLAVMARPESFLLSYTNSFAAFEQIALGCLLCLALERWRDRGGPWLALSGSVAFAGIVLLYRYTSLMLPRDRVWGPSAMALCLCVFLFAGIRRRWLLSGALRFLAWPGQLSYGAYLFHPLMLFVLWPRLAALGVVPAFLLYATCTLLLSGLLYFAYEQPANVWLRRRLAAAP